MDPVSAIGVAAAVVQSVHLGLSLQALKTCREIRDSVDSSTERNAELESFAKAAAETRNSLLALSTTAALSRRISTIVKECEKDTRHALDLLKYVRDEEGKAKGKLKPSARLFCRG